MPRGDRVRQRQALRWYNTGMSSQAGTPASPAETWADPTPRRDTGTLGYATLGEGRPGLLLTLGILSIIFGSLGTLLSAGQAFSWSMYLAMLNTTTAFTGAATPMAGTGAATTPAGSLTPEEVAIVGNAYVAARPLSTADEQRLRAALPKVDLPFAPPTGGAAWTQQHVAGQITGSSSYSFGTGAAAAVQSSVNTNNGSIDVNATDVSTMVWSTGNYMTVDATGVVTQTAGGAAGFAGGIFNPPAWLVVAGIAAEGLLAALAILLILAGIFAVRGTPPGRSLHLWWAWPKLALGIIGVGLSVYWAHRQSQSFAGMGMAGMNWWMLLPPLVIGVPGLIYPIVVLCLLRTKRIRGWYAGA